MLSVQFNGCALFIPVEKSGGYLCAYFMSAKKRTLKFLNQEVMRISNIFFTSSSVSHVVVIENGWFKEMKNTILYLYEFNIDDFELQDDVAGYYVAKTTQKPKAKYQLNDLFLELIKRNVEIRVTDNLWEIAEKVKKSTPNWSLCRMGNAQAK